MPGKPKYLLWIDPETRQTWPQFSGKSAKAYISSIIEDLAKDDEGEEDILDSQPEHNAVVIASSQDGNVAITVPLSHIVGRTSASDLKALSVTDLNALVGSQQIALTGSGIAYVRLRPVLDLGRILSTSKPTIVYRGIVRGFSLPIYAADNEELFFAEPYVPARWDAASDPVVIVEGYLDTANNAKKFQLQCSWNATTPGTDVVPATTMEDPVSEVTTGNWLQYQSFTTSFTLNYDVATPNNIAVGDLLNLRLYRIAASGDEIAGEVVITGVAIKWRLNKFYSST